MAISLINVLYVPDLTVQLIAVRKNWKWNPTRIFKIKKFYWNGRNRCCFGEHDSNGQYVIDFLHLYETVLTSYETGYENSHRRLCCPSDNLLNDI